MTENKAVGKITLLIHTRGRKKKINFVSLKTKFDFIHSIIYSQESYHMPDMA